MTWSFVDVDSDRVHAAAARIEESQATIERIRQTVLAGRDNLADGWKGQAFNAFNGVLLQWDTKVREILGELQTVHENVAGVGKNYVTHEQEEVAAANRVAALLNLTPGQ